MAQSKAHANAPSVLSISPVVVSSAGERKLRRVSAWLLLIFLISGELGAVWDREWHAFVGRDQFWTPPHTLIYSGVAGGGLLALFVVLLETYRYYHKKPGVDNNSTTAILGYFHAPLGFSVLGFGALLSLVAAPLDNYWHELYGIDVALWAPFHMMGVTGALVAILGIIYVFASEAAIARQFEKPRKLLFGLTALELGSLLVMASFFNFVLVGFLQFPVVAIGAMQVSTYPIPLAMATGLLLIGAVRLTHKPGAATVLIFFLLLHTLLSELFVPWAVRTAVAQQGLDYRLPGVTPYFRWEYALMPLAMLIGALIVDLYALWRTRRGKTLAGSSLGASILGMLIGIPTILISPFIIQSYSPYAQIFIPVPGLPLDPGLVVWVVVVSVLVTLLAGAIGGWIGSDFGDIWRLNTR